MKVRIELKLVKFEEELKEYYEKHYKENGVLFDDEAGVIYYDIDLPHIPLEGQRLGTRWGMCIVEWAYWELEEEEGDGHFDKTRVVVCEE